MLVRNTAFAPPIQSFEPIVIAGAGIIGLSVALELARRGVRATVLEPGLPLRQASVAAAGMLAVDDPHNPRALTEISRYSRALYADYLAQICASSEMSVPVQTTVAVQHLPDGETLQFEEESIDPRQLAAALLAAVRAAGVDLREHSATAWADDLHASTLVVAAGAWSGGFGAVPVAPRKGQMLRVTLPPLLAGLREVHRNASVYVVPRTAGPQAGTALIGATVEDAGFNTLTDAAALHRLRAGAAELLPEIADGNDAPRVEAWAGLRPATPDALPVLGYGEGGRLWATGHYRNGILLAPATAMVVADLITGRRPAVSLGAFAPSRFGR